MHIGKAPRGLPSSVSLNLVTYFSRWVPSSTSNSPIPFNIGPLLPALSISNSPNLAEDLSASSKAFRSIRVDMLSYWCVSS